MPSGERGRSGLGEFSGEGEAGTRGAIPQRAGGGRQEGGRRRGQPDSGRAMGGTQPLHQPVENPPGHNPIGTKQPPGR